MVCVLGRRRAWWSSKPLLVGRGSYPGPPWPCQSPWLTTHTATLGSYCFLARLERNGILINVVVKIKERSLPAAPTLVRVSSACHVCPFTGCTQGPCLNSISYPSRESVRTSLSMLTSGNPAMPPRTSLEHHQEEKSAHSHPVVWRLCPSAVVCELSHGSG